MMVIEPLLHCVETPQTDRRVAALAAVYVMQSGLACRTRPLLHAYLVTEIAVASASAIISVSALGWCFVFVQIDAHID